MAAKKKLTKREQREQTLAFSKKLINDTRHILWVLVIGGILLAFYCVHEDYVGALGWIAGMESAAFAAHGTVCSFYMNMAKSDHKNADGTGITFASAQATNFGVVGVDETTDASQGCQDSPMI